MNITPEIWEPIVRAVREIPDCPDWLRKQVQLSCEVVNRLPILDSTAKGQHAAPTIEKHLATRDYLNFLREQINLNSRGKEWVSILTARASALEPFVGKELLVVAFYCKPATAIIRIDPETKRLIHYEVHHM